MISSEAKLLINDSQYHLAKVLSIGATGPAVAIDAKDIVLRDERFQYEANEIDLPVVLNENIILFYKFEGKFRVLAGQNKVETALENKVSVIKGKLVSTPALKKARIEVPVLAAVPEEPWKQQLSSFQNQIDRRLTPRTSYTSDRSSYRSRSNGS